MKLKGKLTLAALSIIFLSFSFISDDNTFLDIINKIKNYNKKYPQEKLYIQLNQPYYIVGDDIWIKGYVVNSATNVPSEISKILYAELISEQDSIITRLALPLSSGISWGNFSLPDSLIDGNYRIRAYTNWMRNFSDEYFFDKTIKIGKAVDNKVYTTTKYITSTNSNNVVAQITLNNKDKIPYQNVGISYKLIQPGNVDINGKAKTNNTGEIEIPFNNITKTDKTTGRIELNIAIPNQIKISKVIPIKIINKNIDIQFMPEGGNMIENIPSKIAFKAINSSGKGQDISILIKDQNGNQIDEIKTVHQGMGSFTLNPQPGIEYYAEIKLSDGTINKVNLPKPLTSGYSLSVNNNNSENINAKIILSEDLINKGNLNLIAQHGNKIYYSAKASTTNQIISINIPKGDMPSGILTLTLFNPQNQPVCERLTFINNIRDFITINESQLIAPSKRKEKINLNLIASNTNKAVQGSFSVVVNNITKIDIDSLNESNVITSLLLTSDLTGYIENPNYYFNTTDNTRKSHLDLLLLTQGWKRYYLNDVINDNNIPITYKPELGLTIEGFVSKQKKPLIKMPVFLFASAGKNFAIDTLTDQEGKFVFNNLFFNDSTSFMIKVGNEKKSDYDIKIVSNTAQKISINKNNVNVEVNVGDAILDYIKKNENYVNEMVRLGFLKKPIELNTVEIKSERSKITESANFNGPGKADVVVTAEELKNSFTLRQYIEGRVSGIRFEGNVDTPILIRNGPPYERMKIIIDGMETYDDDALNAIPITDLASVEVLKSIEYTFAYGTRAGVILITTKIGSNYKPENYKARSIATFKPKGYNLMKQFYIPKYGTIEQEKDYRNTVFWKPNIISDKDGNINIEYLNANEAGKYRILIEGIDSYGNLGRKVLIYDVN